MIKIFICCFLLFFSFNSFAFTCRVRATGQIISYRGAKQADVTVSLVPKIGAHENIIIDFSQGSSEIDCKDDLPQSLIDIFWPTEGNEFIAPEKIKNGSLDWWGKRYSFPMQAQPGNSHEISDGAYHPLDVKFTLSPTSNANGVIIKKGQPIGYFEYHQKNRPAKRSKMKNLRADGDTYGWRILAGNDVVIPTGTCEANAYDTQVTLNNYNPNKSSRTPINLSVHCATPTNLSYSLEGNLESDTDNSVFKNTADNPAKGIGIRFFNNGKKINRYDVQKIGTVDNSYKSLNLSADYGVVKGVSLSAGDVRSQVTVNITYS
ncbi:fimbrial protein [Photobacterium angustum]|uniref:FimH protein n=1 Tax=Photobacterium angustum (strain S14 / CCUG 15956) TaxID=314292 RepID=Q1ZU85_PHOAS|nr:fimbrial protein [Photobacterium angustum]EAS66525.1 FimH protein precursor [Photobacterium angustum S14]